MKKRICIGFVAILLLGLFLVPGALAGGIAPDNGFGTVSLPPPCPYDLAPGDSLWIIDGLPSETKIQINARLTGYSGASEGPGGSLGGDVQTFSAQMPLLMTGTGDLAGYTRTLQLAIQVETHTGPRMPGDPVQSFDTDMFRLQGQMPPPSGDPDFDLLRITAGTGFGLPSPGHTTLTQLPDGNWAVDSFFDITYRIDFVGAPGGPLSGRSGSTTGTARFLIVPEPATLSTLTLLVLGAAAPLYRRRRA